MPFEIISRGVYRYNGVIYHEVDCGGGGNCLFLSLAYLLRFNNLDATASHSQARGFSAAILTNWVAALPGWIGHQYEQPTAEVAAKMANDGVWGTVTAALAVAVHYNTIELTILGPKTDDVHLVDNLSGGGGRTRLFLFYSGYNHYRALIPAADIGGVPDGMRLDKNEERKLTASLFASLKTTSTSSSLTNTTSASSNSYLEIHHIDVGQGDATLIYVKDEFKSIVKSILIDTGESDAVSDYLNVRISYGDFRPLDILIMSHWDRDHMGAAAALIKAEKYTQQNLRIIDLGDPESEDQDAMYFLKDFRKHPGRELPTLYRPLVDDCLGFTLYCYMFNGLVGAKKEGYVRSYQDWSTFSQSGFFPQSGEEMTEGIISARNCYFPSVKDKNNRSIALVISFHGFTYFTAGDLSGSSEEGVAEAVQRNFGHCCAWKLGHHGAGEASSPTTLGLLQPRFGVVSCGTDNDYGHPSGAALEHLEGLNKIAPCDIYVTTKIPSKASGKKFQPGQITGLGFARDAEGDIIIEVSSKDKHRFEVFSNSSPKGIEFKCGEREYKESNKIKKSTKRSFRDLTGQDQEEAEKRRNTRLAKFLRVIKETLKEHKDIDAAWLENAEVENAIMTLARRIYRAYGEYCGEEIIIQAVKAKIDRQGIDDADDLETALLKQ
jgi:beta-lactamase superfamily II metal-dependent hydrolase